MIHVAILLVRATVGGLLAGHGAQKLFGWFGGYGLEGTSAWLESMGRRPGRPWAVLAGMSEFLGGLLVALGALNPIGPLLALGAMLMATVKVHLGKPIWVSAGGAELPVTNIAVMLGLMIAGPGRLSVDSLLRIRIPRWVAIPGLAAVLATVTWAQAREPSSGVGDAEAEETTMEAGAELQAGASERMGPEGEDELGRDAGRDAEEAFAESAAAMSRTDEG